MPSPDEQVVILRCPDMRRGAADRVARVAGDGPGAGRAHGGRGHARGSPAVPRGPAPRTRA